MMVPWMAASVYHCFVLCCLAQCYSTGSSFTREKLLNITETTPVDSFPRFLITSVELLDILVKGALTFAHAVKRLRTHNCTSVLVRLCNCGLHVTDLLCNKNWTNSCYWWV